MKAIFASICIAAAESSASIFSVCNEHSAVCCNPTKGQYCPSGDKCESCGDGNIACECPSQDKPIAQVASWMKDLSTLTAALQAADLVDALSGSDMLTLLAPSDAGFSKLGKDTLSCLTQPVGIPALADVLKLHVLPVATWGGALKDGMVVKTLEGGSLTVHNNPADGFKIEASNQAAVVKADVQCSNGVIHELADVLIPEGFKAPQCGTGTVAKTAAGSSALSTLVAALTATDLVGVFDGQDVYTVFAPTNDAFAKLGGAVQCLLQKENLPALKTVLLNHVLPKYVTAEDIVAAGSGTVDTLDKGESLKFAYKNEGVRLTTTAGVVSEVITPDVFATNGIVHVIDTVLLPQSFIDNNPCASGVVV